MLDERKASILRAVVEEYIETALPVGSGHVASAPGVSVSSATVRNEMAALEAEGYLAQPHTSAGRIPTEKGYRYFVDALSQPVLDRSSAQQARAHHDRTHGCHDRLPGAVAGVDRSARRHRRQRGSERHLRLSRIAAMVGRHDGHHADDRGAS